MEQVLLSTLILILLSVVARGEESCPSKPRDCGDIQLITNATSGVYKIYPEKTAGFNVYCDLDTAGGGWTVIQRRVNGSEDFYRKWADYMGGFGNVDHEFWLGHLQIHAIVSQGFYELRIDMVNQENERKYAGYYAFTVGDLSTNFKLTVDGFHGDAGNSLRVHNGMNFTTQDRDNDGDPKANCALAFSGAWWYAACLDANLNGVYGSTLRGKGIVWIQVTGAHESLKWVDMKVRKIGGGGK